MALSFGSTPGIQIDVAGGALGGVTVGTEEIVVLFGRGDPSTGSASVNSPTQVTSGGGADAAFGEGTRLAQTVRDAIANGANAPGGFVFGVMPQTNAVSDEAISGGSGTLGNAPIVLDLAEVSVENTTDGTAADNVEFRFDSAPTAPTSSNEVHINPYTGEVEAGDSDDYAVDYKFLDFQAAFDSADKVVGEGESGIFVVDSAAESVASTLFGAITPLRDPDFRLIKGIAAAQPNANTSGTPPNQLYEANSYSDSLDSFPGFAVAPGVQDGTNRTLVGALAGLAAGNSIDDPILTDSLSGVTVETGVDGEGILTKADRDTFADNEVIPLNVGDGISVARTPSTDTDQSFETTFQSVRVLDRAVLLVREVAKAFRGRLDVEGGALDTEAIAAQTALGALEDLVDQNVLQANTDENPNRLFVRPADGGPGVVALEVGVTPVFAVDTFTTEITVNQ